MAGNNKKLRGIKSLLGGLVAHIESGNFFHRYPPLERFFCPVPSFGAQVRTPGLKRAPVNGVARDLKGYTASFFRSAWIPVPEGALRVCRKFYHGEIAAPARCSRLRRRYIHCASR